MARARKGGHRGQYWDRREYIVVAMAALKTLDDWLRGSGCEQAFVQAEIATPGTAESFLRAAHGTRTRRAHQITATALHILQHRAYERHPLPESFRLDFEGDVRDSDLSSWQIMHSF